MDFIIKMIESKKEEFRRRICRNTKVSYCISRMKCHSNFDTDYFVLFLNQFEKYFIRFMLHRDRNNKIEASIKNISLTFFFWIIFYKKRNDIKFV